MKPEQSVGDCEDRIIEHLALDAFADQKGGGLLAPGFREDFRESLYHVSAAPRV